MTHDRVIISFHPVWRDYPISTIFEVVNLRKTLGFPSRLAGLSYFHEKKRDNSWPPRRVSIPSGGIILFPPIDIRNRANQRGEFPSRLAGLSYFHRRGGRSLLGGQPVFHPLWRG